ncbi:Na+/melibiose symporter [Thermomonospora echinospora]|uniref:Na+/melibiose symporter n=1 Tax=Thermomonospora echinospora TaxID=1992 RepID=A0A1H6DAM9_9ACTN|nr:MFS transporter [Thermomonospora echinospora]SEG82527.1 Na+/melibiose symporter [Thermomonospora echinospora]
MYFSSNRAADAAVRAGRSGGARRAVAGNVLALGLVSLVTDVSAEMVTAVLPLYLVLTLGLSPLVFGLIDGGYAGVTAVVRLLGGHLADRLQRRKLVAGLGYGVSAAAKLGLLAAGGSPYALGAVLAADRTGKGVRTAPRDALITLSSDPRDLGTAFGVHRAMDTAGALAGPFVAFAVLWAAPGAYDAVFVVSACLGVLGVLLLMLFVRDRPRRAAPASGKPPVSVRAALRLVADRRFGPVCAAAGLLGLFTVSDAFLYLLLQRELDLQAVYLPLLPVGTAVTFLLLSYGCGRLSDRIGARPVFLGGHLLLLAAYVLLLAPLGGPALLVPVLALHGAFYAATDGVLMAAAGPLLPEDLRTSGLAILQTGQALARLLSSVLVGAAWTAWGPGTAVLAAALLLASALPVAGALLRACRAAGQ